MQQCPSRRINLMDWKGAIQLRRQYPRSDEEDSSGPVRWDEESSLTGPVPDKLEGYPSEDCPVTGIIVLLRVQDTKVSKNYE